jgi:copper chaperone CopZ
MHKSLLITSLAVISLIGCSQSQSETNQVAAAPIPLTIYIDGMTCESCNNAVNTALTELEGISEVEADYITGKATLKWESEKVTTDVLLETVNKLGYKASLQPSANPQERAEAKLRLQAIPANVQ